MAIDPLEGVDGDGYITTGAAPGRVRPPYDAVLADVTATVNTELRHALVALFVYGSVANGQAGAPHSDVDLVAVVAGEAARDRCADLAATLTRRHRGTVRDVGLGAETLAALNANDDAAYANRCFLKHYGVLLAGTDVTADYPRCRPSGRLVREFIGDYEQHLGRLRDQFATGQTADHRLPDLAGPMSRRLGRTAAVLYSTAEGRWSTAAANGYRALADRHPTYAESAALAASWLSHPMPEDDETVTAATVAGVLDGIGELLRGEITRLLG